jgi:hypothetical protein
MSYVYCSTPAYFSKGKVKNKKNWETKLIWVLQWPKVLEEKEKVTRLTIFGSGKYLPSQKYVMMIKNIFYTYICASYIWFTG